MPRIDGPALSGRLGRSPRLPGRNPFQISYNSKYWCPAWFRRCIEVLAAPAQASGGHPLALPSSLLPRPPSPTSSPTHLLAGFCCGLGVAAFDERVKVISGAAACSGGIWEVLVPVGSLELGSWMPQWISSRRTRLGGRVFWRGSGVSAGRLGGYSRAAGVVFFCGGPEVSVWDVEWRGFTTELQWVLFPGGLLY